MQVVDLDTKQLGLPSWLPNPWLLELTILKLLPLPHKITFPIPIYFLLKEILQRFHFEREESIMLVVIK